MNLSVLGRRRLAGELAGAEVQTALPHRDADETLSSLPTRHIQGHGDAPFPRDRQTVLAKLEVMLP